MSLYFAGHTESFQIHMVFDDPGKYTLLLLVIELLLAAAWLELDQDGEYLMRDGLGVR